MRLFQKEKIIVVRRKSINKFAILFVVALATVLLINYITRSYIPYINMKCNSGANNFLNDIINKAVEKELRDVAYDSLAKISYDSEGNVKSILCDTVKMNIIKHRISDEIIKSFKKDNSFYITIPLVYISKNPFISNVGPKVKVRVEPLEVLNVDFNDSFISKGINQTKHEINIVVKTGCYTYLSGFDSRTDITTTLPVVHTIIVGEVPETYTNVEGTEESVKDDVLNLQ